MRSSTNFDTRKEKVLERLKTVCSAVSAMRSDEELRSSFDSFLMGDQANSASAEGLKPANYFRILEEIICVLHELEEHLMTEGSMSLPQENSQVDSSNRLYASLKRHPE